MTIRRGPWVIVCIFSLALAMAAYAWQLQRTRGRQVLAYLGWEHAERIARASSVELWALRPLPAGSVPADRMPATRTLRIAGVRHAMVQRKDLSRAPGIVHARQALLDDASFHWPAAAGGAPATWQVALRFEQDGRETLLAFDLNRGLVRLTDKNMSLALQPASANGFRRYLDEQRQPGPREPMTGDARRRSGARRMTRHTPPPRGSGTAATPSDEANL